MSVIINIEGIDGAGKSTGLKYFIQKLKEKNAKVLETREVGSPHIPINIKLRELVLDSDSQLSGEAMELIFCAMRLENDRFYKKVSNEYDFIVSDRGWLSHLAYTDHNVNKEFTKQLYIDFMSKVTQMPDIVVYFSINPETALNRRISRGEGMDVIEMKGVEFQQRVANSFEAYMTDKSLYNTEIYIIDANQSVDDVELQLDRIIKKIC